MTRLLISDDHATQRRNLVKDLSGANGIAIVADVSTRDDVVGSVERFRPDIVLIDITCPGNRGAEAASEVRGAQSGMPILCLTDSLNRRVLDAALRQSADGFAARFGWLNELVEAIDAVVSGRLFVSPALMRGEAASAAHTNCHDGFLQRLSLREREIIAMIADGETTAGIAHSLGISGSTVYFHRRKIAGKTGLRQTADLTRFAVRAGLTLHQRS